MEENRGIVGIDHVLLAVSSIEISSKAYERMGFTLTPIGIHPGGTGNRTIMFPGDYLELITILDKEKKASGRLFDMLMGRGNGVLGSAWVSTDVDVTLASFIREGIEASGSDFSREVVHPEKGAVTARFKLANVPGPATPAGMAFAIQHLTPDLIRCDEWTNHANGAIGLTALEVVFSDSSMDPQALYSAYARLLGPNQVTLLSTAATAAPFVDIKLQMTTSGGRGEDGAGQREGAQSSPPQLIRLWNKSNFLAAHPALKDDPTISFHNPDLSPAIAAIRVRVRDVKATSQLLQNQGVVTAATLEEGAIVVGSEQGQGVALIFHD